MFNLDDFVGENVTVKGKYFAAMGQLQKTKEWQTGFGVQKSYSLYVDNKILVLFNQNDVTIIDGYTIHLM